MRYGGSYGMTQDVRDGIRADARVMGNNADVARKWFITRERVRQLLLEKPDEERRALERELLGDEA